MRRNRVTRVLGAAAELAKLCKTRNWGMDHGHLVGLRPRFNNSGEPVIGLTGKQQADYIDIAMSVTDREHRVTGKAIGYDGRADLRLMASMGPNVVLQLLEDYSEIIKALEAERDDAMNRAERYGARADALQGQLDT